jgi:hypothetical protein
MKGTMSLLVYCLDATINLPTFNDTYSWICRCGWLPVSIPVIFLRLKIRALSSVG